MLSAILIFVGCWFALSVVVGGLWCALVVPRNLRDYPPVDTDMPHPEPTGTLTGEAA